MTVDEWLTGLGQSEKNKKFLWNVITTGALNNDPTKVSALMLFRVLRAAFLGKKENASLFIPHTGLSDLFVNPAVHFIRAHGGTVHTGAGVNKFMLQGTHIASVQCTDGRELQAEAFISAVPWYSWNNLLLASDHRSLPADRHLLKMYSGRNFRSSPIISLHLWLDREITDLDFAALLETRIQWLFNKSKLLSEKQGDAQGRQYLSLVISGAEDFIGLQKDALVTIAMEDLRQVLAQAGDASVIRSLVIKEKRATFIPSPGLEQLRPGAKTQFDNLFLAGDWTATGYPATIEGAVMSGRTAAELIG